jgi:germination protein YpeB
MLAKKAAGGEAMSDEEKTTLTALSDMTGTLSGNFTRLLAQVNDGTITLEELNALQHEAAAEGKEAVGNTFGGQIKTAEQEFPETPTLIYDGPFSSHIADMKPRMLAGLPDVTRDDAAKAAAAFVGEVAGGVTFEEERGGNLPVYVFSVKKNDATVEVSKAGGKVINMFSPYSAAGGDMSSDDAAKKARAFLEKQGFANMRESYRQKSGNIVTINYAHAEGDVVCYPDLIKVAVALDDGHITGFEAQGYVMNHHARTIPAAAVTEDEARAKVSKSLKILSHALTIIPTAGKNEQFCHEFKGETETGQHYITYVDAATGVEARILILLEDENGTLTI